MDKYLEGADKGLKTAIANLPQPPLIKKQYSLKDMHSVKATTEKVFRHQDDGTVICFSSSAWQAVGLSSFYPPDRGKYKFRISAFGFQSQSKPVVYRIDAGVMGMTGKNNLVGYFDAPGDKPTVLEFTEELEPRATIRILPYGLASAQAVHKIGADAYDGPGLAVQWVEVEGPLYESWPPLVIAESLAIFPLKQPLFTITANGLRLLPAILNLMRVRSFVVLLAELFGDPFLIKILRRILLL